MDRRLLLDNFELVLLTLDEIIDDGVILEVDEKAVKNRVLMKVYSTHFFSSCSVNFCVCDPICRVLPLTKAPRLEI